MKTHQAAGSSKKLHTELEGYLDMGMARESLAVAEKLLELPKITASDMENALSAVMRLAGEPVDWGPKFEAAFQRLPVKSRESARITLFSVHAAMGEYEKAEKFLSLRHLEIPRDLALAMDTLLDLGRLKDAASVARQCSVLLNARCVIGALPLT